MGIYPKNFKEIVKNPELVAELNKNCHFNNPSFEKWKTQRSIIARAINKEGSIMDIGCANGWLLRCLQEWSEYKLVPYGIDTNSAHIKEAKELFEECKSNFKNLSLSRFKFRLLFGLSNKYDFILWNVWDNKDLEKKGIGEIEVLRRSLKKDGSLILAFYENSDQKGIADTKIAFVQKNYPLCKLLANESGSTRILVLC